MRCRFHSFLSFQISSSFGCSTKVFRPDYITWNRCNRSQSNEPASNTERGREENTNKRSTSEGSIINSQIKHEPSSSALAEPSRPRFGCFAGWVGWMEIYWHSEHAGDALSELSHLAAHGCGIRSVLNLRTPVSWVPCPPEVDNENGEFSHRNSNKGGEEPRIVCYPLFEATGKLLKRFSLHIFTAEWKPHGEKLYINLHEWSPITRHCLMVFLFWDSDHLRHLCRILQKSL